MVVFTYQRNWAFFFLMPVGARRSLVKQNKMLHGLAWESADERRNCVSLQFRHSIKRVRFGFFKGRSMFAAALLFYCVLLLYISGAQGFPIAYEDDVFGTSSDFSLEGSSEADQSTIRRRPLQDAMRQLTQSNSAGSGAAMKAKGRGKKWRKRKKRLSIRQALNATTTGESQGPAGDVKRADFAASEVSNKWSAETASPSQIGDTSSAPETVPDGSWSESTVDAQNNAALFSTADQTAAKQPGVPAMEDKPSSADSNTADFANETTSSGENSANPVQSRGKNVPESETSEEVSGGSDTATGDGESESGEPASVMQNVARLRTQKEAKATEYYRLKRHLKYLQKSVELKKGESRVASSQVELEEDEIKVATRQLQAIREREEKTKATFDELKAVTREMRSKAKVLSAKSDATSDLTTVMTVRLQHLTVEEVLANSARGLPDSVAGALRRSAEALTPFMDTLMIAVDTNQRLVDHVGAEIDKYTHMNIRKSPFLSGILFYSVLLVPTLTLVSFARRVFDSSSNLTVSHFIVFGNVYYMAICTAAMVATFTTHEDPAASLHRNHEKVFAAFNLLLAFYYIWHVGIMSLQAAYTREKRNIAQLIATLCIGVHYFLFTWRRIFTRASPEMIAANYGMYLTILGIITAERVSRIDMTVWFLRRHLRSRSARQGGNDKETTVGALVSLLSDMASNRFTSAPPSLQKGPTKPTWERDRRTVRDRRPLLRSSQSDEEFDAGEFGRDLEAVHSRRPQSARHPENTAAVRHKRRPPAERVENKGFAAMFFGSRDDNGPDDTSDEDDDSDGDDAGAGKGWWHRLGRVTGYAVVATSPNGGARERARGATLESARGRRPLANHAPPWQQTYYESWFGTATPSRRDN